MPQCQALQVVSVYKRYRMLLWLCRQFCNQPVLRVPYGVWAACVYVTLPAKTLAAAVTVRQTVAEGGDDGRCDPSSVNLIYAAAFPMCIYINHTTN
jgi:hypothetical protein